MPVNGFTGMSAAGRLALPPINFCSVMNGCDGAGIGMATLADLRTVLIGAGSGKCQLARRDRTSARGFPHGGLRSGTGRSKMYITFTYPWTGRGPWHILKAAHTLNLALLITGAFAPGPAKGLFM